jgi:hypothetical protein
MVIFSVNSAFFSRGIFFRPKSSSKLKNKISSAKSENPKVITLKKDFGIRETLRDSFCKAFSSDFKAKLFHQRKKERKRTQGANFFKRKPS